MHINATPKEIWPLLCPVREYDWIEVWDCEVLHTESGFNELGCVFQTHFPTEGDSETWVTSRFEPATRLEFVRTNSSRVIYYVVTLHPEEKGTRMTWTQHVTALNEDGIKYIKDKPQYFATNMGNLEAMLNHYLETGEMLKAENLGLVGRIKSHVYSRKTG